MPCLLTALTRLAINKTTGKKRTRKWAKTKTFSTTKIQHLNLEALSNDRNTIR